MLVGSKASMLARCDKQHRYMSLFARGRMYRLTHWSVTLCLWRAHTCGVCTAVSSVFPNLSQVKISLMIGQKLQIFALKNTTHACDFVYGFRVHCHP